MLRRILLLTALVAGTIIPATVAEAATPTVALTFQPARVSANTTLHLAVKSANLPTGTVLYLQRQFGTDHIFKNVKQLTVRNGTTTAPAVAMGRYVYRIRAMRNTTVVARSANRTLYSYGNISVTQLCNRSVYTYCA
jgi:hypothetical protein